MTGVSDFGSGFAPNGPTIPVVVPDLRVNIIITIKTCNHCLRREYIPKE
jgi:hypothetical protein